MIKKCCGNDVAAFAKLSHVTFICTYSDRWKYVSGEERFLCRSHIGVNICRFVKSGGLR